MNVLVLRELDAGQLSDLAALLARCEQADGHPALAEPQRMAVSRPDLAVPGTPHGAPGVQVLLAYEGPALVGCAVLTPGQDGVTALHVAVDPGHRGTARGWPIRRELIQAGRVAAPGPVRLWIMGATDTDDAEAHALGFGPERDLLQMRVPLPLAPDAVAAARPVETRAFRPGQDDEAWLTVNNRAFEGHPEQGGWTLDDLHERMRADWFDPNGFLVADRPDGSGMIGSCWTKLHRDMGEIYVISVDPSHHGEGWGRALTVAGLQWMAGQGVGVGMLYTTASNTAAVALYESLGFTIDHVDRSYLIN
ncbi:MAG: mycothiol synthase [Acidimicrobiales bacterium]